MRRSNNLIIQCARFTLGFSWIYHGFFPKLYQVDPVEKLMTSSFGFTNEVSLSITRLAGIGEILFGLLLIVAYRNRLLQLLNMLALGALLLFVAIFQSPLLIAAFNPVTTNIPLMVLSLLLYQQVLYQHVLYQESSAKTG